MEKIVKFIKKYYFIVVIVLAIVVKYIITVNLPINARDPIGADEYLMLQQAEQLSSGNYLGPYDCFTLVKGIGFPMFLAFSYKIGISLLALYSAFYTGVCLIALVPIRRIVKKRPLQLLTFLLLLFCPATMDGNNVQLIYRNMLIIPQSVLLISALMMMYYHVKDNNYRKLILWSLVASLAWIFMWHTREDSIWSVPLLIITWIVLFVILLKKQKIKILRRKPLKIFNKRFLSRLAVISLPFLLLYTSIHVISFINYKHYGIYTTNQLNNSNYTKAVMLMMRVKPSQEIERVEITHETLQRLYNVSPSLRILSDTIEADYENKTDLVMAAEDNGEINEDLITWELIGAANIKGYYKDARTAERFWGDVYDEIDSAIKKGELETRAILPSRSLIPFPNQPNSFSRLIGSIGELFLRAATYENSIARVDQATIDESITERYEAISGGYAVRTGDIYEPSRIKALRWTTYANHIRKIYRIIGPALLCISLLYYIWLTVVLIISKNREIYFERWLFLSASLGGLTTMLIGLGYVNAFMVDVNGYIASCNGLSNLFFTLSLVFLLQDIIKRPFSLHRSNK